MKTRFHLVSVVLITAACLSACGVKLDTDSASFTKAKQNALQAKEGFTRCNNFLLGWLLHTDPKTGLIPRNLGQNRDIWNAHDAAADNYAFMVLSAAIVNEGLFATKMLEMLETERRLTSRVNSLPDVYSFTKEGFLYDEPLAGRIIFGASEYMKDGLLPVFEWLGPSPWSDRLKEMLDDLRDEVHVIHEKISEFGSASKEEVNGELMQVLSRMYWITGDATYLEWAVEIGDYYLAATDNPLTKIDYLRIRDHGCEFIAGLSELYITLHFADINKKEQYKAPFHRMLDIILEKGRNEDGLFYNAINPNTGEIVNDGIADTWGYTLNAYYTVYLADNKQEYLDAVLKALSNLDNYRGFDWERGSSDGYADAIESALTLNNRIKSPGVYDWIDSEIQIMWGKQKPEGVIEGWHGDGNFARTTLMYCFWKTAGTRLSPWDPGLSTGAFQSGDSLFIALQSDSDWKGKLLFDRQRHKDFLNLPVDYPRINQFPEWFTVVPENNYVLKVSGQSKTINTSGSNLSEGIEVELKANQEKFVLVTIKKPNT